MNPDRWRQVKAVLDAALERPSAARAAFLAEACDGDSQLRTEVESLLGSYDRAGSFMDHPVLDNEPVRLKAGMRLGPYEVLAPIGAGGMGEVYKAQDTRLGRIVAIKVLPQNADPDARQRFDREARLISNLKHQHICAIYDVGHERGRDPASREDAIDFLVMEFLDGETLAARLMRGALPIDHVLRYAIQIAEALDHAHSQGIVHRDLKPANIMLTKTGAKLLDFGLAKLKAALVQTGESTPTGSSPLATARGTILGTLQYMAPEQLEGKEADARTDISAFGAVVYEMTTGRKAFEGNSQASLIAAIFNARPAPLATVQPLAPPALDRVVRRCLERDPDDRWQSARDLAAELRWIAEGSAVNVAAQGPPRGGGARLTWWLAVATILAAAVSAAIVFTWFVTREDPRAPHVMRFSVVLPEKFPLRLENWNNGQPTLAVSPDGRRLVFVADTDGRSLLVLHDIDRGEATPIAGTERATHPFFSPDGRWVGFFADGQLKKVAASGGAPVALADLEGPEARGASWGRDDTIVFGRGTYTGLFRVSANGGAGEALTRVDFEAGERHHRWPHFLPGDRAVLFTIGTSAPFDKARIALLDLDTGERRTLFTGGSDARYAPTGHIVYGLAGSMMAVPFDLKRREITGPPVRVVNGVRTESATGAGHFAFSDGRLLVYAPGSRNVPMGRVAFLDREGKEELWPLPPRPMIGGPRISPDGRRIAFAGEEDLWVYDLFRGALTRVGGGTRYLQFAWSPDNQRIVFSSEAAGPWNIYMKSADGTGPEERLLPPGPPRQPQSFSPDGRTLAFIQTDPANANDIWLLTFGDQPQARPFIQAPFAQSGPKFSPDGRWLSYVSNESGRPEAYIQAFPGPASRIQVSTGGAIVPPCWSRDGRSLYYRFGDQVYAADISTAPSLEAKPPRLLFTLNGTYETLGAMDITPDGRLLLVKLEPQPPITHLNVVVDWFAELQQRMVAQ